MTSAINEACLHVYGPTSLQINLQQTLRLTKPVEDEDEDEARYQAVVGQLVEVELIKEVEIEEVEVGKVNKDVEERLYAKLL